MATEKRLIDAKDFDFRASQSVMTEVFPNWKELPKEVQDAVCKHGQYLHLLLETQPTVDAAPVVHGEWIDGRPYVNSRWKVCSVCHCTGPDPQGGFAYCPNCGAKMDGGKANEM